MWKLRNLIFYSGITFLTVIVAGSNTTLAAGAQLPKPTGNTAVAAVTVGPQQIIPININLADAATLQKIKEISKRKAQAIINYRTKNGPFTTVDDLLKVKCRGIHKNWLDKVRKFLTV